MMVQFTIYILFNLFTFFVFFFYFYIFLFYLFLYCFFFFFSSRRRHTRCGRDWSSDVCSSDLKSFAEAQFVITDSYHGCIFSIIFKKPFFVIANKKRGNSRFLSLLRLLNLEDRLIYEGDIGYLTQEAYSIDWTRVNQKLETERNKSIEFINTWL